MQKIMIPRVIPALLAIAFAGGVNASGFQLMGEQSASGIGNAGAGSAAVAENASTIYYNPAGMTQLQAREVSAGLSAVKTGFKFTNDGSITPGFSGNEDGGGWGFVPNAYGSWALTKDIYIGLGIGAPFGLKVEYDDPWQGSAHSNSFEITTMNINPSIAWRANEWLSLGAGINYQSIDAIYKRNVAVAASPLITNCATAAVSAATVPCKSKAKLEMDDGAWGWNIGALFTVAPRTKIGMSYRSEIKYKAEGDVKVTGPSAALNAGGTSDIKADVTLPDTFILSVAHGLNDRIELLGDVSWTGWSSIPYLDIVRTSGPLNGTLAQKLDTRFDDAWRFALGANYKLDEAWKLRFGIAYDQTPVPSAEYRLTSLPDNDRTWFSAGFQYKPAKNMAVDVGAAYIYLGDTEIDNDGRTTNPTTNKGLVKGDYDNYSFILGGQFSMSF
jgi:long-chain fatty acid transport protein